MLRTAEQEPCKTCLATAEEYSLECSQWELLVPVPVKEAIKSCGTCEHERVFSTDSSFCYRCASHNEWEPEEDPKVEANDERIYCPFPNGDQLYCRQEKCGIWVVDGRTGTGMCALVMMAERMVNR
jgi:hypothetical protein